MEKVFVGKIVNTHGIKGEFRIKSDFEMKSRVFVIGKNIYINNTMYEISSYRVHKNYDMITVKGLENINDVIPFKGKNLYVDRESLSLDEDEYILSDLIDARVCLNDMVLGVVSDYTNDANPLLSVKGDKDFYIPLKGNYIVKFDKREHILYVNDSARGLII